MANQWEKDLACASQCARCHEPLASSGQRILSVYDHQPICLSCKREEEARPDYEEASRNMIGLCMADTEVQYADPGGYCYFHFYPFTCKDS
jgi:predicted CXXCH cytochrome family protein